MQENIGKKEYLAGRRKHFLWGTLALVLFGAILYFASVVSDYAEKNDIENFDEAKDYFFEILKKDFAIFPEGEAQEEEKHDKKQDEKSLNLLKIPLLLNCSVENGRASVNEPFEVARYKVTDAVFELASHGNTMYSLNFSSKENAVYCKGTMKEGQQKIFVYYCEKI
ncbi:hypothetical protein J5681_07825 [bacterium]|nr:hypothetical protein [bacterium]